MTNIDEYIERCFRHDELKSKELEDKVGMYNLLAPSLDRERYIEEKRREVIEKTFDTSLFTRWLLYSGMDIDEEFLKRLINAAEDEFYRKKLPEEFNRWYYEVYCLWWRLAELLPNVYFSLNPYLTTAGKRRAKEIEGLIKPYIQGDKGVKCIDMLNLLTLKGYLSLPGGEFPATFLQRAFNALGANIKSRQNIQPRNYEERFVDRGDGWETKRIEKLKDMYQELWSHL